MTTDRFGAMGINFGKPSGATTNTAYLIGVNAKTLAVNVNHDPSGQTVTITGYDTTSKNRDGNWAREVLIRVRAAINLLGLPGGFVVSFDHKPPTCASPDLAIVAACLKATSRDLGDDRVLYLGSLGYSGQTVSTRGVLPILESVEGFTRAFVPQGNAVEASFKSSRITCLSIANVHDLIDPSSATLKFVARDETWFPFSEATTTRGLSDATICALAQASSSGKNVLIVGAKSWGAAKLFHEISPRISMQEAREVACLHSIVGLLTSGKLPTVRPFRAPHHSVADQGLVGGGWPARPGEVSLASWGTLVLDHVLDFKRGGLACLADVVRTKQVVFVRREHRIEYPAHTRIVGTVYPDELRFFTPERVAFLGDYVRVDV